MLARASSFTLSDMKKIITLALMFHCAFLKADFLSAELGIDGLTCSQCSRSVEMKLRTLYFVQDVQMNLENNIAQIHFLPGKTVEIDKLAKAVFDAGFSVRYLIAAIEFADIPVIRENELELNGRTYHFLNDVSAGMPANAKMEFVSARYMAPKTWKKWKNKVKSLQSSCDVEKYYVILQT